MLDVAVAAGVQVQEQGHQSPFHGRADAPQDAEARAGQLGRAAEVQDPHALAEVHVVLGLEGEGLRVADAALLDRELLRVTLGRVVRRQVRDAQEQLGQLVLDLLQLGLGLADLLLELAGRVLARRDVAACLGRLLDLLRHPLGFERNSSPDWMLLFRRD